MSGNADGATGVISPFASASEFGTQDFLIQQSLSEVRTATLVRVVSCTNAGGISPVGYVDLQILVQRLDGAGNVIDAGKVYDVPYSRIQGGANAVIMDPEPGDIGFAAIADRDISAVKASGDVAAPGSDRRHNTADAIYLGGLLNGAPTQYVQFSSAGIKLVSPTKVEIDAPAGAFNIDDMQINGASLKHNGVNIGSTHAHPGVTRGSASTDPPTP